MPPPELLKLLEYAAYGAIGGLIGGAAKDRRLALPRMVKEREEDGTTRKVLDPGFMLSVFVGAVLAFVIDHRPQTAIAFGIAAGYVGPAILSVIVDPILAKVGYQPHVAAPSAPAGAVRREVSP